MDINTYYAQLTAITGNREMSPVQRIDEAFKLKTQNKPEDSVESARLDSITYSALTAMLDKENAEHAYDTEMLQLLTLTAEAMVDGQIERSLKDYRLNVNPLVKNGKIPFTMIQTAVERIVDALRNTVFNHDRYSILDTLIRRADKVADNGEEYDAEMLAESARELYRLDNLLSIHGADDMAILKFISEDELIEIRNNPTEGHLKKDRIEYTRRWESVYYEVQDRLDEKFKDTPRGMGFCFEYWQAMADLLAREYGILWRNPHQMNPGVIFD